MFGYAWTDLKSGRGWFVPNGTGKFKDRISFIPDFNGGIYYMRRSERCRKVFDLANYFAENFSQYSFNGFTTPADEPCLALAMAVEQCMPLDIKKKGLVFAPAKKDIELDISKPLAFYHGKNCEKGYLVNLIHWSNYRTKLALYKFEVRKLTALRECKTEGIIYRLFYRYKIKYYILMILDINTYMVRAANKIWRSIRNF